MNIRSKGQRSRSHSHKVQKHIKGSPTKMVAAWRSGNALVSINVVALRRSRLVLGWVTVRGYSLPSWYLTNATQVYSAWSYPSVGRHNEYWLWSRSPLGKKRRVLRNSGHVPGLDCWHTGLVG